MEELRLGKLTNKELAEWFGISEKTLKNNKIKKLEELKLFADFYEEKGKVIITDIYESIYSKKKSGTLQKVIEKIDNVWSEDGLDSCTRVGSKIYEILSNEEDLDRKESTIIEYTRKGRNELYGKPFGEEGKLGKCIYIWCKRDKETGEYSLLSEKEQKIKQDLQTKYFGDATEKQILVKGMVESGEIKKEEAWSVLEEMTNMNNNNFLTFLKEIQEKIGCQVIRGTLVERKKMDYLR